MNAVIVLDFQPWRPIEPTMSITNWRRSGKWYIYMMKKNEFTLIDYANFTDKTARAILTGIVWEDSSPQSDEIECAITMMTNTKMTVGTQCIIPKHEYTQKWRKNYLLGINDILQKLRISFEVNKALQMEGENT